MSNSSFLSGLGWFFGELKKIVNHPIGVAGGFLDVFRAWRFSRNWLQFWFHLPFFALLCSVFVVCVFSLFGRVDTKIQQFSVESETHCSTKLLESICSQSREEDFLKAMGGTNPAKDFATDKIVTDLNKRYVELLSKRILSIESNNQFAHYRLAMIHSLNGQEASAESEMTELASGLYGEFPPANAWIAKDKLIAKSKGEEVLMQDLLNQLDNATKWKDIDYRLLIVYSRLLEQTNNVDKAIEVCKKAVAMEPETNLELARLYARIENEDGLRETTFFVEELYGRTLNTPQEKESDRLAVAEANRLSGRLEQAAELLGDGLRANSSSAALRRELSEVQRLIYNRSMKQLADGSYIADLTFLEKSAETDSSNPNISGEIARLLPLKIRPSKKLLEVLKVQIDQGIPTPAAHMLLADGFLAFGNIKEAMKNWELGLSKDPNNAAAINNLALCLAKQPSPDLDRVFELFDKALALAPSNPEILDSLGEALMIAKRPKEAINKFELSIRQDRRRISTRRKLVAAYNEAGMAEMANMQLKVIDTLVKEATENETK